MEPPILAASALCKRFGALTVLGGVDLAVRSGEAVGVVGPNGAGKTTLMAVLSGALPATSGTVRHRGEEVGAQGAAERCRRGIVRTHQIPRPFGGMTVFENVLVAASARAPGAGRGPVRDASYERCADALRLCGMLGIANRRAETLGLLDRKRLELARALGTAPSLLLLDEIGGGLTDAEAGELVTSIRELRRRGITVIWIEHLVHVLMQVIDRLICMDGGRVIADGEPRAVMADRQVVDAYLGSAPA